MFLFDIADFCESQPGDTIAVFGCGPDPFRRSAGRRKGARDRHGAGAAGAGKGIDFEAENVHDRINELTHWRGVGARIDASVPNPFGRRLTL